MDRTNLFSSVGVGDAYFGKDENDMSGKAAFIFFPIDPEHDDADPELNPELFQKVYMTIPCVKELIIDLQSVVDDFINGVI
jgi:hypothetical protein